MTQIKKVLWVLCKAFRYCFPYIFVYILVHSFRTVLSLATQIVNKNIVNELTHSVSLGRLTGLFMGLAAAYILFYFMKRASGFLWAFGSNFYRLNVDMLFGKIFMWKSVQTPQAKFFERNFMERYSFVSDHVDKISAYIGSLVVLVFSNIGTIAGAMVLFAIYEPLLLVYSAVVLVVSAVTTAIISKKEYALNRTQVREQRFHDYYKELLTDKRYAKELRIYRIRPHLFENQKLLADSERKNGCSDIAPHWFCQACGSDRYDGGRSDQ